MSTVIEALKIDQKNVAVTASTGKAASVLKEKLPQETPVTTIHRFAGLLDGRYDNEQILKLMNESETFERPRYNIIHTDTLIIDEISMLSSRTFSQLEFLLRKVRGIEKPFGGIQVILAGDLRQLPPVPNMEYGDDGSFFIAADDIVHVFHVVQLKKVERQEEEDLINAINEVARFVYINIQLNI